MFLQAAGKYKQEGKTYVVQDGDIIFFKFNVSGGGKKWVPSHQPQCNVDPLSLYDLYLDFMSLLLFYLMVLVMSYWNPTLNFWT